MFEIKFFRWLSSSISKGLSLKHSDHLLHRKCNWLAKLIVCFLCLNIIVASTYHVICIELYSEGISKGHFQLQHCYTPHDNESGKFIQSHNHKASHTVHLYSESKAQSCPECIDQHIQLIKNSPETNLFALSFFKNISPIILRNIIERPYAELTHSIPLQYSYPLSSFRSSVIRSTIMLI